MRRHKRGLRLAVFFVILLGMAGFAASALKLSTSETRFAPYRARLVEYLPFKIKTIHIEGRNLTSEEDLLKALGTSVGEPIFGFSVTSARERIDTLPFVDHATVQRHMPDTITIKIVERSPIAVWQAHGQFILINREGERVPDQGLEGKNGQAFVKLPLVVGEGANLAASSLVDALTANPEVQGFVVAAVRIGQRRWNLSLRDGATVLLPEGQEQAALSRLAHYQAQFRLLERPVVSIDMRLPDRMTVHQNPSPSSTPSAPQTAPGKAAPGASAGTTRNTTQKPSPSSNAKTTQSPATHGGASPLPAPHPKDGAPAE
ncbi:hypothetical protein JCM15831A_17670 [Asaia astilbis]